MPTLLVLLCSLLGATHYETLGVAPTAKATEIKRAYYKLARELHPDKVADPNERAQAERRFKLVAEAHSVLVDSARRHEYDASLERGQKEQRRKEQQRHQQQRQQQQQQQRRQQQQQQRRQQQQAQQQQQQQQRRPEQAQASAESGTADHEARARAQVRNVESMLQLRADALDADGKLRHHLLLAMHDSRDRACTRAMRDVKFPFPFADWSQPWHGVWWGDIVFAASHDVGPSLRAGRPSAILAAFEKAVGPATRSSHGVSMPRCPVLLHQRLGARLGSEVLPLPSDSAEAFQGSVFEQLQVQAWIDWTPMSSNELQ